jgi:hypothetical protein
MDNVKDIFLDSNRFQINSYREIIVLYKNNQQLSHALL